MNAGTCECGCGKKTRLAPINSRGKGWVKGTPLRFIKGHNTRANAAARSARSLGNRGLSSHGYVRVNVGHGKRQYEHILVMEKKLGRPLRFFGVGHADNEVVHHIDGDKTNNSQGNLEVITHGQHCAMHTPRKGTGRGHRVHQS